MRTTLPALTCLLLISSVSASFAQTAVSRNTETKTVTFTGSTDRSPQIRNGIPVSKTYQKNEDGTVTFQESQIVPAQGQNPVVIPPQAYPVAPYPVQPGYPAQPGYVAAPAPYPQPMPAPQPNILPSGVVNTDAVIRVENLKNPTTNPNPTNSLGTYNQR